MGSVLTEILVIIVLIAVNGVLSGAELAIVTARRARLEALASKGSRGAALVLKLRADPEQLLATVQIGITLVGATAGAFGGATLARHLEPMLEPLAGSSAGEVALALVVAGVTYLTVVIGELVPKSLAIARAEGIAVVVARPVWWLSVAGRPLVWLLSGSSNLVLRLFGDRTSFTEGAVSLAELKELVNEAAKSGAIDEQTKSIAERALVLPTLTAGDVMVPRPQVVMVPRSASMAQLRRILLESTHSRFPVSGESVDDVVGYLSIKDVLALAWEGPLVVLDDIIRPAFFVPESAPAAEVLEQMRARRTPMAMVVDERGGFAGVCTIEDVLEELVGDILTEHAAAPPVLERHPDGSATVGGAMPVRDVNRELGLALPEDEWATIAGLCLGVASTIPPVGARLDTPWGVSIEVVDATPRRVRAVRIHPA